MKRLILAGLAAAVASVLAIGPANAADKTIAFVVNGSRRTRVRGSVSSPDSPDSREGMVDHGRSRTRTDALLSRR